MATPPAWLALFAPLPDDAVVERKPVASPELIASGKADAIAGWDSISVHLSDVATGLRHVLITLDANDRLLSASDLVLFERKEQRGPDEVTIYDQENIGGRFERDGSFRGTYWQTRTEQVGDDDDGAVTQSTPFPPTDEQIATLRHVVADILRRAPARESK